MYLVTLITKCGYGHIAVVAKDYKEVELTVKKAKDIHYNVIKIEYMKRIIVFEEFNKEHKETCQI